MHTNPNVKQSGLLRIWKWRAQWYGAFLAHDFLAELITAVLCSSIPDTDVDAQLLNSWQFHPLHTAVLSCKTRRIKVTTNPISTEACISVPRCKNKADNESRASGQLWLITIQYFNRLTALVNSWVTVSPMHVSTGGVKEKCSGPLSQGMFQTQCHSKIQIQFVLYVFVISIKGTLLEYETLKLNFYEVKSNVRML